MKLSRIKQSNIKKFSAKLINYDIKFKNISNELIESINMIEILFKSVVKDITDFLHPDDKIKVFFDHPNFSDDVQTKFMKVQDLDAQTIIDFMLIVKLWSVFRKSTF